MNFEVQIKILNFELQISSLKKINLLKLLQIFLGIIFLKKLIHYFNSFKENNSDFINQLKYFFGCESDIEKTEGLEICFTGKFVKKGICVNYVIQVIDEFLIKIQLKLLGVKTHLGKISKMFCS